MRSAFKHGAAIAPYWIKIIEAANDWGKAPWEITKRHSAIVWYLRYVIYNKERTAAIKSIEKQKTRRARSGRHP